MTELPEQRLQRTKEQVGAAVKRLAVRDSLPSKPPEGSLWGSLDKAIIQAYVARAGREAAREGRAIIMAGPPGAGKSHGVAAVRQVLGPEESRRFGVVEDGYVTVDADDVKQLLLGNPVPGLEIDPDLLARARQHWDAVIAECAPEPLADGRPLLRGELATLVHPLSTATADSARKRLVAMRTNIKIEGTLQWMEPSGEGQGPRLLKELAVRRYTQVSIVAVDASKELCLAGAHHRWAEPRSTGDVTARYAPPEAVESMFTPGNPISRCIDNARTTHDLARQEEVFKDVNLFIAHRGERPAVEHIDQAGKARVLPARPQQPRTPTVTGELGQGRAGKRASLSRTRRPGLER
ncbi:hypothetical protein EII34_02765 [Arachnia propionica]|uniref:UDP-N-acetylglucosamine kinase n=1 Tax=Arachnia propionica TaxID=1750 RepID=A0A3P1TBI0_9ACTN|nr:hypothetical protein [Arachnia propionica]RRD06565.1 hypothetical protein EII34_02765 [Arachnia propionica]